MRLRESERETGWPAYHSLSENVLYILACCQQVNAHGEEKITKDYRYFLKSISSAIQGWGQEKGVSYDLK